MKKLMDKYNIKSTLLLKILIALAIVIMVVLGIVYINVQRSQPMAIVDAEDRTTPSATAQQETTTYSPQASPTEAVRSPAPNSIIVVYVSGHVHNPGVFEMVDGARLWQAIELAGGMTEYADENAINLASELFDGQHIIVFGIEDNMPPSIVGGQDGGQTVGTAGGLININTATAAQLQTLSGIGEARARDIINHREARGGFASIEEIMNVPGIGEGIFARIRYGITVD